MKEFEKCRGSSKIWGKKEKKEPLIYTSKTDCQNISLINYKSFFNYFFYAFLTNYKLVNINHVLSK